MARDLLTCVVLVAVLAGCAAPGEPGVSGRELTLRYARVTGVERVPVPSAAPAGAVFGGFSGLVIGSRHSTGAGIAGAAGGAALGALATRALEGDRLAYGYDLQYVRGGESRFITEKGFLRAGDCVVVERGEYANLRRVASSYCETLDLPVEAQRLRASAAGHCSTAKQQLLDAADEAALDAAARKVELLCQY